MIAELRDRPFGRLTSHFFRALFDFGVLSEAGTKGLTRVILGVPGGRERVVSARVDAHEHQAECEDRGDRRALPAAAAAHDG